jgi:striatin 1/3/4
VLTFNRLALIEKLKANQQDDDPSNPLRQEAQREKSRQYLERCLQEITYLLTPPAHAPPPNTAALAALSIQNPTETNLTRQAMEEAYLNQQRLRGQAIAASRYAQDPANAPVGEQFDAAAAGLGQGGSAENLPGQQPLPETSPLSTLENISQPKPGPSPGQDSRAEKIVNRFDQLGSQLGDVNSKKTGADIDWDFDDNPISKSESPPKPYQTGAELFPGTAITDRTSPPLATEKRKTSLQRRRSADTSESGEKIEGDNSNAAALSTGNTAHFKFDSQNFKVRFALKGHLDVIRSVIFTGGGSPSEPEICSAGDDGIIKRWIIPASYGNTTSTSNSSSADIDIQSYFTHRGHTGTVTSLAAYPLAEGLSGGGRAPGDGWIFSGGQDSTIRVWERGRVDPKATIDGHTDAVWCLCVLPGSASIIFDSNGAYRNRLTEDQLLLVSGSADGTVKVWAVTTCPSQISNQSSSRRGTGNRRHSISSGSGFPSSPQPSTASDTPFNYTLIHTITRADSTASPTCIAPLSASGETFIVSYADAAIVIYDTKTGEEIVGMASLETYDGTPKTGVNAVAASIVGLESGSKDDSGRNISDDAGATGLRGGVEGVVISGHEDQYIRLFDANSGMSYAQSLGNTRI